MKRASLFITLLLTFCLSFNILAFAASDYETDPIPLNPGSGSDYETDPVPVPPGDSGAPSSGSNTNKKITVKATKIKKLRSSRTKITVIYNKVKGVSGYQIQVARDKKFKKGKKTVWAKKAKVTKKTVKKLKPNKKYYVRVRAFKKVNGKKHYSKWSKIKAIKTKK